jgi:hypothetical protein
VLAPFFRQTQNLSPDIPQEPSLVSAFATLPSSIQQICGIPSRQWCAYPKCHTEKEQYFIWGEQRLI